MRDPVEAARRAFRDGRRDFARPTRFVNEEIDAILQRLLDKAENDIARARTASFSSTRSTSSKRAWAAAQHFGESVQHALLKIMERRAVKLHNAQYLHTSKHSLHLRRRFVG